MADTRSPEKRTEIMQAVGSKDTRPELRVRRELHRLGYRYRLHRKDLPGRPDLIFPKRKKIVFIHGCFWHWHGCKYGRLPRSNLDYWRSKLERNVERDKSNVRQLELQGWSVFVVWQCELRKEFETTIERLTAFLDGGESA